MPNETATVQIPATTANLGPGFDCLGIALALYNRVSVRQAASSQDAGEMAREAARQFFAAAGCAEFGFDWKIDGDVPRSRGLGSSVTVRLGLLHGLNRLAGSPLDSMRLFEICAALEGHPDNAAPAAFGGFAVSGPHSFARFDVEERLRFVLLVPPFEVATPDARRVLPAEIGRLEAVRSCANACRITAAFAARDYEALRGAFGDGLHQPFREPLVPFLRDAVAAGEAAGALGGFLSGSGSTVCCVTLDRAEDVSAAMLAACGERDAYTVHVRADNRGVAFVD